MLSKSIVIIVLFNLPSSYLHCQTNGYIFGIIRDAKDHSHIPFANIYLKSTSEGTISNEKGQFRLFFTDRNRGDSLVVSFVGYKQYIVPFSNLNFLDSIQVKLEEQPTILKELEVIGTTPFTFLREAAKKTNERHLSPVLLNSYYREFISKNGHFTKFADALVDYFIEYRKEKKPNIQVKVTESRSKYTPYEIETKMGSDINIPQQIDIEMLPRASNAERVVEKVFKDGTDYNFDLLETSDGEGNEFYKIKFTPKQDVKKILYEGEFYIHKETSVIHSAEYFLPESNKVYTKTYNLILGTKVKATSFKAYIQYQMIGEKCHLRYAKISAGVNVFDKKGTDITHVFTTEMLVNLAQYENVNTFDNSENYRKNSIYKRGNNYKTKFWEGQRGLLATEEEEKIIQSLDTKNPLN